MLYELRSKTADFLDEQSGEPSFLGVEREPSQFDSDFYALVPKYIDVLRIAPDTGSLHEDIAQLSIDLFRVSDQLGQNTKLQRDGYHAAWVNHRDDLMEAARSIRDSVGRAIERIEANRP